MAALRTYLQPEELEAWKVSRGIKPRSVAIPTIAHAEGVQMAPNVRWWPNLESFRKWQKTHCG
jgi:hypothetical protein